MMKKKVLLRFDDICPTMNWEQWYKVVDLLGDTKCLLGVIPDCKDPDLMIDKPRKDFWLYIKKMQDQGHTIAMHGYQHIFDSQCKSSISRSLKSEFAGHSYETQYQKIKKGRDILLERGIHTDIFFAPAHSYDGNTLKALAANGFKYMSDGKSYKPYNWHGIKCLPARSSGVPSLRGVLRYYTAIFHVHEWVREEKKKNKEWFEMILSNKDAKIVPFDQMKDWKDGNSFMLRQDEKLFVIWSHYMKPMLKRVAKVLVRK